ncbi:MAG: hypothetical protein MSC31_02520 [Solirubrobacteraceae bacterium MAG38_C4-C5]|nr:hypothetical protein [Candidatus Siliceabacter maunaloa]
MEAVAAVVAIPLSGLVATVGTSLAFYEMSRAGAEGWNDGWDTLANTVAVALGIIFGVVRLIARHQSGADPLPFEPNVDPHLGIDALRRSRTRRSGSLLHGQWRFASDRVNETVQTGAYAIQPTLREAVASVVGGVHDRKQLLALLVAAILWVIVTVALGGNWWVAVAYCSASLVSVIVAGGVGGLVAYYDRLRWARRESALREKLRVHGRADDEPVLVTDLQQKVDVLTDEVRALRILVEKQVGPRSPRGWLLIALRRSAMRALGRHGRP